MQFSARSFVFNILQDLLIRDPTVLLVGDMCDVTHFLSYDVNLIVGLGNANCKVAFRNKTVVVR
jgi:hypothetical protein